MGCGGSSGSELANLDCDQLTSEVWTKAMSDPETSKSGIGDKSPRTELGDRIIECGTLDGKSWKEVLAWLGKPTYNDPMSASWFLGANALQDGAVSFAVDRRGQTVTAIYVTRFDS